MSAPTNLRANHSHLFGSSKLPALEAMFKWELSMYPSLREKIGNQKKMSSDITQTSELADMPLLQQVQEGQDYTYSRPRQGASKTITALKYGLGFTISEEMVEDGKFDFIGDMVRKLAKSAKETQEINFMNLFNNGFSSATTADGVSIFNSDHTLPSGGTYRNVLSTAADLSPTSLQTALIDFANQFVGDTGIFYKIDPKILLVASNSDNAFYARELVQSTGKVDSSDNNINSLQRPGLVVVESPHLTDTDAWFLLGDKADHSLTVYSRKPIETKAAGSDAGFDNDSMKYKCRYREEVAATNGYGVFGSAGA
jgi:hypothetical protein